MKQTKRKLNGFYNYTVILTYLGMLAGFTGIARIADGKYWQSMLFLMLAGFCDMFDGAVASTKSRTQDEKRFGIQIDSLSDLICFGVLPALFCYSFCGKGHIVFLISCLYMLCALIRLAYFNVLEENRQKQETGSRSAYLGLPVTSSALVFPLLLAGGQWLPEAGKFLVPTVAVFMAFAFVLPFQIKKPHSAGKIILLIAGLAEFCLLLFCVGSGV